MDLSLLTDDIYHGKDIKKSSFLDIFSNMEHLLSHVQSDPQTMRELNTALQLMERIMVCLFICHILCQNLSFVRDLKKKTYIQVSMYFPTPKTLFQNIFFAGVFEAAVNISRDMFVVTFKHNLHNDGCL